MEILASFARYIFRTFTSKATFIILYYVTHQWFFNDTEIDDLEWPFCVKICFGLGMGWCLRLLDKNVRTFAELLNILSATEMQPRERSFWHYKVHADIRGGLLERGRQMRVASLKMAIFASFVHCLQIILHTWPHDSFHVIQLSMTLAIVQGHWTVSHHISQLINVVTYGNLHIRFRFRYGCF